MALWNDKRTPPGVVTDSSSGQLGRMGAGNGGFTPLPTAPRPASPSTWRTPNERAGVQTLGGVPAKPSPAAVGLPTKPIKATTKAVKAKRV